MGITASILFEESLTPSKVSLINSYKKNPNQQNNPQNNTGRKGDIRRAALFNISLGCSGLCPLSF